MNSPVNTISENFINALTIHSTDNKDDNQLALLDKFCDHPSLPEIMQKQIIATIRSTGVNKNDSFQSTRHKRRKRNTLLSDISVELGLVNNPLNLPFELMIEPTNHCNLKCPLCPTGNGTTLRNQGRMKLDNFKKIIDELEDEVRRIVFWGFGEPFLNADSSEMIRYAAEKKIHVITSSNGTFLNKTDLADKIVESGLRSLYIALDGLTQETLSAYRVGADLNDILNGVHLIKELRQKKGVTTPELILQFVVTKENEHELKSAESFFNTSSFDKWSVKKANVMATTDSPDFDKLADKFIPENDKNSRFERNIEGKLRVKGDALNKCHKLFTQSMINWDGDVVPCCWDAQSEHLLGNIFKNSFSSVWYGDKYKKFRKLIYTSRKDIQICCDCPTDRSESKLSRQFTTRRKLNSL